MQGRLRACDQAPPLIYPPWCVYVFMCGHVCVCVCVRASILSRVIHSQTRAHKDTHSHSHTRSLSHTHTHTKGQRVFWFTTTGWMMWHWLVGASLVCIDTLALSLSLYTHTHRQSMQICMSMHTHTHTGGGEALQRCSTSCLYLLLICLAYMSCRGEALQRCYMTAIRITRTSRTCGVCVGVCVCV